MILSYTDNKKSAPIILFIHGTASGKDSWKEQCSLLQGNNYRLISIDLRGHGNSKNYSFAGNLEDHLNDLNETIMSLNIKEKITIVGHSFGAVLALKYTERNPQAVQKLLLVSLPTKVPSLLHKYYKWLLGKPLELIKERINFIQKLPLTKTCKLAITTDINAIRKIWEESLKWDFLSNVPKVNCPVYLSVGRFDYVALSKKVEILQKRIPNSTCKVFKWASHNCIEQAPLEFNEWVISALGT